MVNATAITEYTTGSCETFDPKINNWAEGVLLTIDADSSKLTIRGTERPYASEYAKMLKSINEKTESLTQEERAKKSTEIRANWKSALETAHAQEAKKDRDMTFVLPGKDKKLVIVDETPFYRRDLKTANLGTQHALTDKECKAVKEMKDLKVGECVVIGYESGIIANQALALIKVDHYATK